VSPFSDPLLLNAPLRRLVVFAVLACALLLSCFHVSNLDIGGHVTVGREIILTKSIPKTDFFSHTAQGRSYPVHQWFGELVLFGVEHGTGPTGLILLRMLVVLIGGVLLYRNARREDAPVVVAAAIVLLLIVAARPRFLVRPFLITLVFLPLLQAWIADLRQGRTRRLWPVLVLMGVWGHVHSGVIFGVLYLGGIVAGEGLKIVIARGRSTKPDSWPGEVLDGWNYRRLVIFSAIAIVLPFVTVALVSPAGVKPLVLPFLFFQNEGFRSMIAEYRTVDLARDWPFNLVAGAVLLGVLLRPKRVDLTHLLIVGGFGFLAFQAVRGILPFAAVAAPMLGRTWGAAVNDLLERVAGSKQATRATRANRAEAIMILLVVGATVVLSARASRGWMFPFGFGLDPKHYPERALDFMEAQGVRGPIFNTDIWASSILRRWHGDRYPVFVDARLEVYPEEFWKESYYRVLQTAPGWRDVLRRYDVQSAILRREPGSTDDRIGEALWQDPDWALVYWDDWVLIFVRHGEDAPNRHNKLVPEWEMITFLPRHPQRVTGLSGGELVDAANEIAQMVEWSPDSFLPHWALASAWTGLGQGEAAVEVFDRIAGRPAARGNPTFTASRAEAELVAGRRDRWAELLRESGRDPASSDELFRAAALVARGGQDDAAIGVYREVLAAAPRNTDAMNNLALLLARDAAGIDEALQLLEEAIRLQPRDPYYFASRGEVRWRAGDAELARGDFEQALEMLPESDAAARGEVQRWIERVGE
jgi:tetratricopeptide (TPR) repeat protein